MTSEADTQAAATSTGKGASHPTDPAASLPEDPHSGLHGPICPRSAPLDIANNPDYPVSDLSCSSQESFRCSKPSEITLCRWFLGHVQPLPRPVMGHVERWGLGGAGD